MNCRKMEEHVWPEPEVYDLIKDDYVLVSLYVDDKKELPKDQQHIYENERRLQEAHRNGREQVGHPWRSRPSGNPPNRSTHC